MAFLMEGVDILLCLLAGVALAWRGIFKVLSISSCIAFARRHTSEISINAMADGSTVPPPSDRSGRGCRFQFLILSSFYG